MVDEELLSLSPKRVANAFVLGPLLVIVHPLPRVCVCVL